MYNRTYWLDHVEVGGEVRQEGTLQDALHFNAMEEGILANDEAFRWLWLYVQHLRQQQRDVVPTVLTVTATNSKKFPNFSDPITVPLPEDRATSDYRVEAQLVSAEGGHVSDWQISDTLTNGFKIRIRGSATSATFKCFVVGGAK